MASNPSITSHDWLKYRFLREAFPEAAERGRLLAAHEIAVNPDARKRVEDAVGVAVAAQWYPEAYRDTGRTRGVVRFLDFVRTKIPW